MRQLHLRRLVEIAIAVALTAAALVFVVARLAAAQVGESHIAITDAWARPSLGGTGTSAAYMRVRNADAHADRLLGARGPVAAAYELHTHSRDGDIVRMRRLPDGLEVPAGATVALAPGGYHLMLLGLTERLQPGATFPLTLVFERAGEVPVDIVVRDRPPAPGASRHGH